MSGKTFCAQVSQETHEPCIGTATWVDTWLLIEYTGAWESRAIEQSKLSPQVKSWIASLHDPRCTTRPRVFPLFIRQHHRPLTDITCFVGVLQEKRQVLYRFTFESYEELLTLDIQAMRAGAPQYDRYRYQEPLYLVCTHGKHDMCCAKYGTPVYQELARQCGQQAWQCSHLGGDKFAANVLCLPQSIYYGRMSSSDIEPLLQAQQRSQLYLKKYRGRNFYTPEQQAAEYYLRAQTGNYELDAFSLSTQYQKQNNEHTVTFKQTAPQELHQITVTHSLQEIESASSCKGCWLNKINTFSLIHYQRIHSRCNDLVGV